MLELIKKSLKDSLIYGLGNISVKLVGLVLIPIYTDTKYISIDDFGVLGVIEVTASVLVAVLGLALYQAFFRWYWDQEFSEKQKSIFFTVLSFLTLFSLLVIFALFPVTDQISAILFSGKTGYSTLLRLMLISVGIQVISQVPLTLMKLQEKPLLFSITNLVKLAFTLLITIYLVVYKAKGLEGIYAGQIVGGALSMVVLFRYLIENIQLRFERKILNAMLLYSAPLTLGSVSSMLLSVFDRYSLNYLSTLTNVAVYSLGYKIANSIKMIVITSVQSAISPLIFKKINDKDNQFFYSKIMTYFSLGVMIVILGLSLFGLEIVKVFTSDPVYWESYLIIPIISMGIFFGMLKDVSVIGLQIMKKTRIIGTIIFFVALLNLGLNIILIPKFHIYGASAATLFSQIIFFLIMYRKAQKIYFIPYETLKILKLILFGSLVIIIGLLISDIFIFWRILIKFFLLVSFPFFLYLLGYYDENEIKSITNFWQKWKNPGKWMKNIKEL